jgi:hypothetical protein
MLRSALRRESGRAWSAKEERMFWTMAVAVQLATQPVAAAAPPEIAWLPIAGGEYPASKPLEGLIGGLPGTAGPRLRRSALETGPFARCLERSSMIDDAEGCVRALLPRGDGGTPLVAIFLEEDRRPNIIGTVVNKSLNVRCVGLRAVARADLPNALDTPAAVERARAPVRQCLIDALRTPDQASLDTASGAATWRFPLRPGGLLRDLPLARGNALERAIVDIEEVRPAGQPAGRDCALVAHVARVVGGWWLRSGDTVALGLPCGTNGVRDGRPALLHVNFERELHFLEPL